MNSVTSEQRGHRPQGFWHVVRESPSFRTVWLTQSVSQLGDQMYVVALSWLVAELTGSKAALAAVRTATVLPLVVCGLVAGALVDRSDRRRVLIACDAIRALTTACFTLLVLSGSVNFGIILGVALVLGLARGFFDPAYMAYIPQLVDEDNLVPANGLGYLSQKAVSILGPGLAGIVIGVAGSTLNFGLNSLSFVAAAAGMVFSGWRHGTHSTRRPTRRGFITDICAGFAYVLSKRDLLIVLALAAASNLCFGPFIVLMPFFVKESLNSGSMGYGIIESCISLGLFIGAMLVSHVPAGSKRLSLFVIGHMIEGLALAGAGVSRNLTAAVLFFLLFGFLNGPTNILFSSLVQLASTDEFRGRVGGIIQVWNPLSLMLGYFVTGRLAVHVSPGILISFGGLALTMLSAAVGVTVAFRDRRARNEGGCGRCTNGPA